MRTNLLFTICLSFFLFGYGQEKNDPVKAKQERALKKLADSSFVANFNGDYDRAVRSNLALLKLAKEFNNMYYLHKGYSILGYNYLTQRDTLKAKESFKKSEEYAALSKNDTATGRTYLDIANFYAAHSAYLNGSFKYFDKAIMLFDKVQDSTSLAMAHYYTIVAAMKAENYNKAYHHIMKISDYMGHIEDNSFCQISVHSQMADYYTRKGNYAMADKCYAMVIEDSKKNEFWKQLEDTYANYSKSLYEQGRLREAYKAQQEYIVYFKKNEELLRSEENKALAARFELEKYKKEALDAKSEKEYLNQIARSESQRNMWLMVLTVALVGVFIYLLKVLRKRKQLVLRLKEKNVKYAEARKNAELLSKAKSKFLSTVSHELRTPLYGVVGISSILMEDKALTHQRENLKSLKFSADYLMALINDVLNINKIDTVDQDVRTTFCVRQLLETMISSFEYKRIQNGNKVHLEIHEDTPDLVAGNDAQLSQVLMNILGNAYKFTKDGDIFVRVKPLNKMAHSLDVQFTVEDTGIGIAKDKLALIFDEFAQVSEAEINSQGTGLGLSIVKKLLEKSNAEVVVESELGKGSSFSFVLPFVLIQQKVTEAFEAPISFTDTSVLKDKSILIVDDNAINRVVTQKILEKENTVCDQAVNGEEAVQKVSKRYYDLVLMDVNMPVKDGIQATREIREFDKFIPIIALTAVDLKEMTGQILNSGMNDIVLKPYNVSDFHKTLVDNLLIRNKQLEISA
ncbi:response regulator [Aureisphaera galaxeae]|uniref:tetratricopeptide repeat-containing hybrid sensor histidine kinase/response regulator n=1 Tax=Aureisphaera galaxeae TaxID=1538023 RepID=UPI00234FD03E|nr:response regulator [Aureisphaera galaxeae]MDC8005532.1 response regulator [Aureisphaera galaxeae]